MQIGNFNMGKPKDIVKKLGQIPYVLDVKMGTILVWERTHNERGSPAIKRLPIESFHV